MHVCMCVCVNVCMCVYTSVLYGKILVFISNGLWCEIWRIQNVRFFHFDRACQVGQGLGNAKSICAGELRLQWGVLYQESTSRGDVRYTLGT